MPEQQEQAKFEGYAIVEVMGHHRYAGFVTTQAFGQAVLFRVDVPALDERTEVLKRPEYGAAGYMQPGSTVKRAAVQGYTKLIGAGSIYAITPCTQEAALKAVDSMQERPLILVSLPAAGELPAPEPAAGADDGAEDGQDGDTDDSDDIPY